MAFIALLPIIVMAQIKGLKYGFILSAVFGVVSFAVSFSLRSVLSPVFQNPLVSIVPRLFIGVVTYFVYKGMKALTARLKLKERAARAISYGVSGAAGVITNTVLVLGMMLLWYHGREINGLSIGWGLIITILGSNFLIELAVTTALCVPISLAVSKVAVSFSKEKDVNKAISDKPAEQSKEV